MHDVCNGCAKRWEGEEIVSVSHIFGASILPPPPLTCQYCYMAPASPGYRGCVSCIRARLSDDVAHHRLLLEGAEARLSAFDASLVTETGAKP